MRYRYRTRPYKHQVLALKKLLSSEYGGGLLMDPRTGKSKVLIDWVSILFLQQKIDRCLIVCPAQMIDFGVWQEQWDKHCPYEYDLYVWDRRARSHGGLPEPNKNRLLVVLVNYEAFSTPGRQLASGRRSTVTGRIKARKEIRRWAASNSAVMGLDESHAIKTSSTKTHTTLVSLRPSFPYRVLLTGTVITKASRPHDIRNQWQFLNPERFISWPTQQDFKDHFGRWSSYQTYNKWGDPVTIPVFRCAKNIAELHELIMLDSYSITRDECFDLPAVDEQIISVTLTRSAKIYDQMAREMVAEIRQHTAEASIPLVQLLRLAQISGGFVTTTDNRIVRVGTEKLDMIAPLLEQRLTNGERLAVVARFKSELDALYRLAQSFHVPVFQIRGNMPKGQTRQEKDQAIRHDGPLIYILQPKTASLGIDLAFLSHMIWYSPTTSYVDFTQCCDRIALSRRSTTFTYLLADGIDRLQFEILQSDGQFLQAIQQSPERLFRNESRQGR